MDILCFECNAKHFVGEIVPSKTTFNDFCHHGKVVLETRVEFPEELKSLFSFEHELSNDFLDKIRLYNNTFSFASFNANLINFNDRRRWP